MDRKRKTMDTSAYGYGVPTQGYPQYGYATPPFKAGRYDASGYTANAYAYQQAQYYQQNQQYYQGQYNYQQMASYYYPYGYPQAYPQTSSYPPPRPSYPTPKFILECKICDKKFNSTKSQQEHLKTHRQCKKCDYVASSKLVSLHEEEEHGLIEGLSIQVKSLDTPEEIAKWIEERKKKYPTDENIAKKQQEQEAKALAKAAAKSSTQSSTQLCHFYKKGRCKKGKNCQYSHDRKTAKPDTPTEAPKLTSSRSLLKMLLGKEVEKEFSYILQCIHFTTQNNFFEEPAKDSVKEEQELTIKNE